LKAFYQHAGWFSNSKFKCLSLTTLQFLPIFKLSQEGHSEGEVNVTDWLRGKSTLLTCQESSLDELAAIYRSYVNSHNFESLAGNVTIASFINIIASAFSVAGLKSRDDRFNNYNEGNVFTMRRVINLM